MSKVYSHFRKIIVLIVGGPIFILGLILIPLPGPGLLVSLLGLVILSQEFDAAEKPLKKAKTEFNKIIEQSKKRSNRKK